MLTALSIRDVVLIDRLRLDFGRGLATLTGETGAGKSIVLDALGLALGARAEPRLVRHGAEKAAVTAEFTLSPDHPALALLAEQDLDAEGGLVMLRRTLSADGRSRAYVNDQPVSAGLARRIADTLVEVHGQFDSQGLLNANAHRALLDQHAGAGPLLEATRTAWRALQQARDAAEAARAEAERLARDEAYLRHASEELGQLAPKPGEETALADSRARLMAREKLLDALAAAQASLGGEGGADAKLAAGQKALMRILDRAGDALEPILETLDRVAHELADAQGQIASLAADTEAGNSRLEEVEDRLFALRAAARKYDTPVDDLAALAGRFRDQVQAIGDRDGHIARLDQAVAQARVAFDAAARALSDRRRAAATALDAALARELPPLKLDRARFETQITALPEDRWGPDGRDQVRFAIAPNPGAAAGPLNKVASGGELSRVMLALKVVLTGAASAETLIFDEVDAGISGATAAAVGERLARLGEQVQVVVVTHSPQVAAKAARHWRVAKSSTGGQTRTTVETLSEAERREEIARMLSGSEITDQARAAADSLLEPAR